jgi:hypothetical protein
MEAEDWLKGVEKKLMIAQCTDHEKVLFAAHQLFGTAANWWETYYNTLADVDSITWNEFKAHFYNHYVPRGTMKLKKKEFADLKQGSMIVNGYLNSFIQLSRYAPGDINTDEKKQDMFLNGLNDDIQFQLLNTDYADFQHVVDKAIVIENKIKEMEKDGNRKVSFHGQPPWSNVRPRFSQPNQFFKSPQMNRPQMPVQVPHPQFLLQRSNFQPPPRASRCRGLNSNHVDPACSNRLSRTCSKVPALMLQLCRVHQLKGVVLVELVSSVV